MANEASTNQEAEAAPELEERVVHVNRSSKVVKGGRNFHYSALVVVGDRSGNVGVGVGKANEAVDAIREGSDLARRSLRPVPVRGQTIPHAVTARFAGGKILLRPASEGTGVIAGGAMRDVLELAGIRDVLAKSLGSNNPLNVVRATLKGIDLLRTREDMLSKRDVTHL